MMQLLIILGLFFTTALAPAPAVAADGFTQQDRELLIELRVRLQEMDKRFEQVDKRFEQAQANIDTRLEQAQANIDTRFEQAQANIDTRFEQAQTNIDTRFEQVDTRFEQAQANIDTRFEQAQTNIDTRFEQVDKRFEQMFQFFYILAGIFTTLVVAVIGFAYWDRRTIIREARREAIEFIEKEGTLRRLLDAFQTLAEDDPRLAAALKQFNLL